MGKTMSLFLSSAMTLFVTICHDFAIAFRLFMKEATHGRPLKHLILHDSHAKGVGYPDYGQSRAAFLVRERFRVGTPHRPPWSLTRRIPQCANRKAFR